MSIAEEERVSVVARSVASEVLAPLGIDLESLQGTGVRVDECVDGFGNGNDRYKATFSTGRAVPSGVVTVRMIEELPGKLVASSFSEVLQPLSPDSEVERRLVHLSATRDGIEVRVQLLIDETGENFELFAETECV